ncbi:E2-like conjugating enzyme atg10 [Coemansia javaensis]|uniref:Ubiquitin-like-conjugating enzyme ATG10 n=1 Tax=Coemansia javaensis TaxID=2761396 RepID=A0A9W8H492_9FUNG|nr:E2-like conjugating enzyme atg10 [Coemansia javaensis]
MDTLSEFPYLTADEFTECIGRFAARYSAVLQVDIAGGRQQQYLRIRRPLLALGAVAAEEGAESVEAEGEGEGLWEDCDPARSAPPPQTDGGGQSEIGRVEYHVVYSRTWRVPVVYVRVHTGRGGSAAVELDAGRAAELLVADGAVRGAMAAVEFGGALGLQDHPELGTPFLYLHPCHTATLLRAVTAAPAAGGGNSDGGARENAVAVGAGDYVAALLSLVGPAVGLALPAAA